MPVDQAAYVIFTSGTTGTPERCHRHPSGAVGLRRRPMSACCAAAQRLGRPPRIAHAWSFTFDVRRGAGWSHCLTATRCNIVDDHRQRTQGALVEATTIRSGY